MCRSEEYFVNPEQFIPERWLPEAKDLDKIRLMTMCVQPFGFGKRNCPGRRIAEQLIHITLIKVNTVKHVHKSNKRRPLSVAFGPDGPALEVQKT